MDFDGGRKECEGGNFEVVVEEVVL